MSDRRQLQLIADTAALAGSHFVVTSATQANLVALQYVTHELGLPLSPNCISTPPCTAGAYTVGSGSQAYTVQVADVTGAAGGTCPASTACIDVSLQHNTSNFFGAFSQQPLVGTSARGIGSPPPTPFGYAIYSSCILSAPNSIVQIAGDVYVGCYVASSTSGQAAFCTSPGGGELGHLVLGTPAGEAANAGNGTPYVAPYGQTCGALMAGPWNPKPVGGPVAAATNAGDCNVFGGATWVITNIPNPGNGFCYSQLAPPSFTPPHPWKAWIATNPASCPSPGNCVYVAGGGAGSAGCHVDGTAGNTLPIGFVYEVSAASCPVGGGKPNIDFDFSKGMNLTCTSYVFDPGTQITVGGGSGTMSSVGDAGCGVNSDPGNRVLMYQANTPACTVAGPGAGATIMTVKQPGLGSVVVMKGTIDMPGAEIVTQSNTKLDVDGQAVVCEYSDNGGNHPGNGITYDPSTVSNLPSPKGLVR